MSTSGPVLYEWSRAPPDNRGLTRHVPTFPSQQRAYNHRYTANDGEDWVGTTDAPNAPTAPNAPDAPDAPAPNRRRPTESHRPGPQGQGLPQWA